MDWIEIAALVASGVLVLCGWAIMGGYLMAMRDERIIEEARQIERRRLGREWR